MGLAQAVIVAVVAAAAAVDGASVSAPMRLRGGAPKPPTRADWIKKALRYAFGWKEGSLRLQNVDDDALIDYKVTISTLITPNGYDANGAHVLRIDVVPRQDFVP